MRARTDDHLYYHQQGGRGAAHNAKPINSDAAENNNPTTGSFSLSRDTQEALLVAPLPGVMCIH